VKTALLVTAMVALLAAVAWALSGSQPASTSYTVEVSDRAGVHGLVISPEVVARANQMPEVVVSGASDGVGSQMLEARGQKLGQLGQKEV
jgi:hypothetical protein